jgi:hypothetical protein
MDLSAFFSHVDADRAYRSLALLRLHRAESLVLTGGLAFELHRQRLGLPSQQRSLNDIDFLVSSFDEIPKTLSADLLFRHVHPYDPPGKTLLQCVFPETAVRVDIFRAYGSTITRAETLEVAGEMLRMISIEDLTARGARLCMDLAANVPVPSKHIRDFLQLLEMADSRNIDTAWQDHRKASHPASFNWAADLLRDLIPARKDLQIAPGYSQDVHQSCSRCHGTEDFPVAEADLVRSILGYC